MNSKISQAPGQEMGICVLNLVLNKMIVILWLFWRGVDELSVDDKFEVGITWPFNISSPMTIMPAVFLFAIFSR